MQNPVVLRVSGEELPSALVEAQPNSPKGETYGANANTRAPGQRSEVRGYPGAGLARD